MIDPARLRVNERPPAGAHRGGHRRRTARCGGAQPNLLPPGPGNLEFRFAAVTLLEPHKSLHRYRLEGFDRSWVEAGARRGGLLHQHPAGPLPLPGPGQQRRRRLERGGRRDRAAAAAALLPDRPGSTAAGGCWPLGGAGAAVAAAGARAAPRSTWRRSPSAAGWRASCTTPCCRACRRWRCSCAGCAGGSARDAGDGAASWRAIDSLVVTALEETRRFLGDLRGQGGGRGIWRWRWSGWRGRLTEAGRHRLRRGGRGRRRGRCPTTCRATCSASPRRRCTTPSSTPRPSAST